MLTIRRETDYALQLLKLLEKSKGKVLSLNEIAQETKISFLFLQKIARKLRLAKMITAVQGVDGGYKLSIDPKKSSLKQIIEAMEGNSCILTCLDEAKDHYCRLGKTKCELKVKMGKVNKKITKILDEVKLSQI